MKRFSPSFIVSTSNDDQTSGARVATDGITGFVVTWLIRTLGSPLGTDIMLRVEPLMMAISLVTMLLATLAITALALCFGALFPRFRTENAADIATGFGGLVFMMSSISYIALVIGMEAWPVYTFLRERAETGVVSGTARGALALGVGAAMLLSVVVISVALGVARRRVGEIETS